MDSHLSTKLKIRQQAQLINNIIRKKIIHTDDLHGVFVSVQERISSEVVHTYIDTPVLVSALQKKRKFNQ